MILSRLLFTFLAGVATSVLLAQPSFDLVPVYRAETTYNTVTNTVYRMGGRHYLYTGGDSDKINVFEVSKDGNLGPVEVKSVFGKSNAVRGLVADSIAGNHYLFAGLKGADAVEVFRIAPDGKLTSVFVVEDTEDTYLGVVITLQVVHMAESSYLFVGGLEKSPGLSSFKIGADGKLEHVKSTADTEALHTDGIIGMSIHRIKGKTYLFTGGFQDNGLSGFEVHEDGTFTNVSNVSDNHTLFLNGTYPVISATRGPWNFVVVGHRHHTYYSPSPWIKDRHTYYHHGDAVSVFLVDEAGKLLPRSAFRDNAQTLIQGQTRLHKLPLDKDFDLIAVATRDDRSLQLFVLNETGRLIDAGSVKTGFPIYYGLAGQKIGDKLFLFAGAVSDKAIVTYRLDKK